MDNIIASICRDAEQKLALHTAEIQGALERSKAEISSLKEENASLKHYINQVEHRLQECKDIPIFHDLELQKEATTSPVEQSQTIQTRMVASLTILESIRNALLHDAVRPQMPVIRNEDHEKMQQKYSILKEYCTTLQSKYRKEKSIWKQWIAHNERKDDAPVPSNSLADIAVAHEAIMKSTGAVETVLTDRNCNEISLKNSQTEATGQDPNEKRPTRDRNHSHQDTAGVVQGTHTLLASTDQITTGVKAEPMSDAAMPPSSSQEAHSLDLDQTTIRKPIDRLRALRELSDDESTTPTRAKAPHGMHTKRTAAGISAVLEDDNGFEEHDLQHEAGKLLEDLLSSPPAVPPGSRRTIKREGQEHAVTPRSLKRTKSESAAPTQDSAIRNASRRRALRSTTEVEGSPSTTDYVINKARNNGLSHAFHEVVRGKEARRKLHAGDCPCCSKFYEMAGPAPPGLAPVWRSPSGKSGTTAAELDREVSTTTRQQVGRHRTTWRRSPTPPSFWEADFPTTQEVAEQKEMNEQRRRRKVVEMQTEASRENGRYVRRAR